MTIFVLQTREVRFRGPSVILGKATKHIGSWPSNPVDSQAVTADQHPLSPAGICPCLNGALSGQLLIFKPD